MPNGRTHDYSIWRACERFGVRPEGVAPDWCDIDWWTQSCLIQYNFGRCHEEAEERASL